MTEAFWLGLALGTTAALSVGPIFLTIVAQAANRGLGAAARVILGSAAADLVLIVPALSATWLLTRLSGARTWVGLAGGAVFVLLGLAAAGRALREWTRPDPPWRGSAWHFWQGLTGNLANPLTWTFWLATGTPTMLRADLAAGPAGVAVFTVTWFVVACSVEGMVAAVAASTGRILTGRGRAGLSAVSALLFLGIAASLVRSWVQG